MLVSFLSCASTYDPLNIESLCATGRDSIHARVRATEYIYSKQDAALVGRNEGCAWRSGIVKVPQNRWGLVSGDLKGYPKGMRYAVVYLCAKCGVCQPGYFGAKIAVPSLCFKARSTASKVGSSSGCSQYLLAAVSGLLGCLDHNANRAVTHVGMPRQAA